MYADPNKSGMQPKKRNQSAGVYHLFLRLEIGVERRKPKQSKAWAMRVMWSELLPCIFCRTSKIWKAFRRAGHAQSLWAKRKEDNCGVFCAPPPVDLAVAPRPVPSPSSGTRRSRQPVPRPPKTSSGRCTGLRPPATRHPPARWSILCHERSTPSAPSALQASPSCIRKQRGTASDRIEL